MISVAESLAKRSTCNRLNVGCVITDDHGFVLSSGYNGAPLGLPHCLDVGCLIEDNHCIRSAHAEQNAIITASRNGTPLIGSTLYSTHRPCFRCLNMLIQAGIKHIIYLDGYEHDDTVLAFETCKDAGVTMKRFER
jgi:dCMP deaminase